MFKMLRVASLLVAVGLLLSLPTSNAFATKYVSIADIKEEVKSGWHQTYTYKGETIQIHAEIIIPDVDEVPIVRVKWADDLHPVNEPATAEIEQLSNNGGFISFVKSKEGVFWGTSVSNDGGESIIYREQCAQAENSLFTPSDAIEFLYNKLDPFMEMIGSDIKITGMIATSRRYAFQKADRSGITVDFNKPLTEMGGYDIVASQVFDGIPLVQLEPFFADSVKNERVIGQSMGYINMTLASEIDYVLHFYSAVKDKVLVEDAPLISFSKVKETCEKLIETGYIRNIFDIRLEYTVMINPDDVGNTYLLIPMWVVSGIIVESPSSKTPTYTDEEIARFRRNRHGTALINAQTAIYIGPKDTSKTRWYGSYITWDEVK